VSRPIGDVLVEAERLFRAGVHELLVVSQDTSAYGVDLRYRTAFWQGRPMKTRAAELARELAALARDHDAWVRLHYVYPYPHVDELLPLMCEAPIDRGLLAYLDIPFQHASPRILRLMKRPAAPEKVLERIRAWRRERPGIVLRSTFIAGFPGETDAEFDELLDFLREAALDRVGCFAYSPVEGAAANALPGAVPEALREERRARLMALQATISTARLAGRVGHIEDVLVDRVERDVAIARSVADAPEIDGIVRIRDAGGCSAGEFVRVAVTGSGAHDLEAEIVSGREASPARDRPRARQRSLRSPH
ncbi:MAG: radical SAM protein, partial [Proteobacteria bacterium]|nr:radical SAM protein [Pseudomonadota bacterium]